MFGLDLGELALRLLTWVPMFLLAIAVHEAAHAWAAWRLGDPTPVVQGRLTLNPIVHIDPIGALMFLFAMMAGFGFGWAKPVPVNPINFRHPDRDMALVSFAGPASNVLQAVFWATVLSLFISLIGIFPAPIRWAIEPIAKFFTMFFIAGVFVNLGLAVFNLLPVPPLDGSRILRLFLPYELRWRFDYLEFTGIGFIVLLVLLWLGILHFVWAPAGFIGEWLIRLAVGEM